MLTLLSFWAGKKYQKRRNAAINRGLKLLIIEEKNVNKQALHMVAQAVDSLEDPRSRLIYESLSQFIEDGNMEELDRNLKLVTTAAAAAAG